MHRRAGAELLALRYPERLPTHELALRSQLNLWAGAFDRDEYRELVEKEYSPSVEHIALMLPSRSHVQAARNQLRCVGEPREKLFRIDATSGILPDSFRSALLHEIRSFQRWASCNDVPLRRPNSMNDSGIVLNDLPHLSHCMSFLVSDIITPLASELFPEHHGDTLDDHHSFIVEYDVATADTNLSFHVDDSDVTLNFCLESKNASGSEVHFRGRRCTLHQSTGSVRSEEVIDAEPVEGSALLHAGQHRHSVKQLRRGRRTSLIVWARSTRGRHSEQESDECPWWCGHNAYGNEQ